MRRQFGRRWTTALPAALFAAIAMVGAASTARAQLACASGPAPILDIDEVGGAQPLTDGVLVVRYFFGFRGATLIAGAVESGCGNCTAPEIEAAIQSLGNQLDGDGDGQLDALTDGLLILRFLFGFRGGPLITGAFDSDCERCTAIELEAALQALVQCEVEPPIFSGSFPAPDRDDLADLDLPPTPGTDGGLTLLELPEGTIYIDPSDRTPVSAAAECASVVLACYAPGVRNFAGCFENVPTCATSTPWLGDDPMCCGATCASRYQVLRDLGNDEAAAFAKAIFEHPSCMPGLAGHVPEDAP